MNPKEKALDLVRKYYNNPTDEPCWNHGKLCAIICVDEILNDHIKNGDQYGTVHIYWKGVKTEIEKL